MYTHILYIFCMLVKFFPKCGGGLSCHFGRTFEDDSLPAIFQMDGHMRVGLNIDGVACFRTAVVVDLSIHINAPARHHVWAPVGADGTDPVMFGVRQLRGDPLPGQV